MQKWEHVKERASVQTEAWRVAIAKMLENRGAEGWELVSVVANGDAREFYFKRPVTPPWPGPAQ